MTQQTTYTQALPKGMALIETAEGRWFPALTPLTDTPHWVTFIDAEARCIPLALAVQPCHDQKQGYERVTALILVMAPKRLGACGFRLR